MYRPHISLLLALFFTVIIFAQDSGLELIHADKQTGKKIDGEKVSEFTGNVHFRQDTVDMYCSRAVFYEKQDRIDFIGNVSISDGHRNVKAKKIEYYPETKIAVCLGDVRLKSPDALLNSDYFSYNFNLKTAEAEGSIYIYDLQNDVKIWGRKGLHDGLNKYSFIESEAKLMKIDTSAADTLIITSDSLQYFGKDTSKAVAIDSVVLTKGALKAVCDTMVYMPDMETAWLHYKPQAWFENNELSGDDMQVLFDSLKVKEIYISGNAVAVNKADSLKKQINELKGKKIRFEIENKKPEKIISMENASSVYYLNKDGEDQGHNVSTADTIFIFFKEGEVDSIRIKGGADGTFYPENYKGEADLGRQ